MGEPVSVCTCLRRPKGSASVSFLMGAEGSSGVDFWGPLG